MAPCSRYACAVYQEHYTSGDASQGMCVCSQQHQPASLHVRPGVLTLQLTQK